MHKTLALLAVLLIVVCNSDAFKNRKRQSSSDARSKYSSDNSTEPALKWCCYPSKFAFKIDTETKLLKSSDGSSDPMGILPQEDEIFTVTEIVDGSTQYSNFGGIYKKLQYVANDKTNIAWYDLTRECYKVDTLTLKPKYKVQCRYDVSYEKQEEKDGVTFAVFSSEFSSSSKKTTKKLYASLNEAGECIPRLIVDETYYFNPDSASKYATIETYTTIEMGPEQERLLQPPSESERCRREEN